MNTISGNLGPDFTEQMEHDMSNTRIWEKVFMTDPKAVKPITGKDYSGNSPKPYWIIQRLTEEFGPCGIGWGYTIDSERFERFSDTDTLHVAKVTLWYAEGQDKGHITQMGQTKASYVTSKGAFKLDEDAPKKSVTDALVKCASYLGFAGDIFSGRWDDSKYVAEARKHYGEQNKGFAARPTEEAFKALQPEIQDLLRKAAPRIDAAMPDVAVVGERIEWVLSNYPEDEHNDVLAGLSWLLDSKTRAAIKKAQEAA